MSDGHLSKTLDGILTTLQVLASDMGVVKDDVRTLKSDVGGLQQGVSGLKSDVSGLKNDVEIIKHVQGVQGLRLQEMAIDIRGIKVATRRNTEETYRLSVLFEDFQHNFEAAAESA